MVDSLSLYMDGALGGDDAASKEYAFQNRAYRVHGRMRIARFRVWNFICASAGVALRIHFRADFGMDCIGIYL